MASLPAAGSWQVGVKADNFSEMASGSKLGAEHNFDRGGGVCPEQLGCCGRDGLSSALACVNEGK